MRRCFIHSIYIETFSIILFVRTLRTLAVGLLVQKLLKAAHRIAQASQLALLPAHNSSRLRIASLRRRSLPCSQRMILNEMNTPAANIATDAAKYLINTAISSVPPSPKMPSTSIYIIRQNI